MSQSSVSQLTTRTIPTLIPQASIVELENAERKIIISSADKKEYDVSWKIGKLSGLISGYLEGPENASDLPVFLVERYNPICVKTVVDYLRIIQSIPAPTNSGIESKEAKSLDASSPKKQTKTTDITYLIEVVGLNPYYHGTEAISEYSDVISAMFGYKKIAESFIKLIRITLKRSRGFNGTSCSGQFF